MYFAYLLERFSGSSSLILPSFKASEMMRDIASALFSGSLTLAALPWMSAYSSAADYEMIVLPALDAGAQVLGVPNPGNPLKVTNLSY
jgi:hypothetical protein